MKKKEKWMKFRHKVAWVLLYPILAVITLMKFPIRVEPLREKRDRPYLILLNHQTPFDQFFVCMAFKGPIYFIATEDIMSNGLVSKVIKWLLAPIPIKKQAGDFSAVITALRVAREGATIAMAPEGNRTYSGKTEYINPAVAGLAKKMKLPIALFRIEGGYGMEPRWSSVTRRGKMRGYIHRIIEPEEYAALSNDELYDEICQGLYVNEGKADGCFRSNKRAEYLERAIYVCPFCGLSKFESHGNEAECLTCHRKVLYGEDKTITGIDYEFPFRFMTEWYDYQSGYVNQLDLEQFNHNPAFSDRAKLSEVIINKRKQVLRKDSAIALYGDRIAIDEGTQEQMVLPFGEVTAAACLGRNKLNLYHNGKVYQFKGDKRFNALKYVHFYYRHRNIAKGDPSATFLGL